MNFKDEITVKHLLALMLLIACYSQANSKPPIQLAKPYKQPVLIQEYFVSEKLDGIRGYWTGKHLLTRSGKLINTPEFFTQDWPNFPLDGEIWLARTSFETTLSIVRKQEPIGQEWQKLTFMVFDLPAHKGRFIERVEAMQALGDNNTNMHLKVIKQHKFHDHKNLLAYFERIVDEGGEGLMLHHQNALYHIGRTANIMKLKPFDDADGEVIEHLPGKGKYKGMLGAIRVKTADGIIFKIGSGFSDNERESPPEVGSIVTFKYSGKTRQGVPRFASFLRVRQLSKVK